MRKPDAVSLICCAYRTLTIPTFHSIQALTNRPNSPWRVTTKTGDALISRARSIVASKWLMETADDVFLMIDDDVVFLPEVAEQIVRLAAQTKSIACAAYPVRDGRHTALRGFGGPNEEILFGPDLPPLAIQYGATGFMAVHRDVLEAMKDTVAFCHENTSWAFWPFFMPSITEVDGAQFYLSEDWAFCERAKQIGFTTWLDPTARIGHLAVLELNTGNMHEVAQAVGMGFEGGS